MSRINPLIALVAVALTFTIARTGNAQQTTVGAGMHNVGDGYFEGGGVGFSARGPNWFFNNGGGGAIPPFGGFNPAAGASLGFGFAGPGFSGGFNINAAQGSSRGMSSTAGSITVPNGGTGFIGDVIQQPFVTSVVPVVGGFADSAAPHFGMMTQPAMAPGSTLLDERLSRLRETGGTSPPSAGATANNATAAQLPADDPQVAKLASAQSSSAGRPAVGIAALRQQQSKEDAALAEEIQSLLDRGHEAQQAGKTGVARIYFEQASRKATGAQKDEALSAIRALGGSTGSR
jgi:hypothetical protein